MTDHVSLTDRGPDRTVEALQAAVGPSDRQRSVMMSATEAALEEDRIRQERNEAELAEAQKKPKPKRERADLSEYRAFAVQLMKQSPGVEFSANDLAAAAEEVGVEAPSPSARTSAIDTLMRREPNLIRNKVGNKVTFSWRGSAEESPPAPTIEPTPPARQPIMAGVVIYDTHFEAPLEVLQVLLDGLIESRKA